MAVVTCPTSNPLPYQPYDRLSLPALHQVTTALLTVVDYTFEFERWGKACKLEL